MMLIILSCNVFPVSIDGKLALHVVKMPYPENPGISFQQTPFFFLAEQFRIIVRHVQFHIGINEVILRKIGTILFRFLGQSGEIRETQVALIIMPCPFLIRLNNFLWFATIIAG